MTATCAIPYCNHPIGPCIGGCTQKIQEWREEARATPKPTPNDIAATLSERGERYGKFKDHAAISQDFKAVLWQNNHQRMSPDQCEALEMICHKMARILNGDPDYVDSWIDIAGYATLVADRLEGLER